MIPRADRSRTASPSDYRHPSPSLFPPYDTRKWNVLDLTRRRDERYYPSGASCCVQLHRQISQIIGATKREQRGGNFNGREPTQSPHASKVRSQTPLWS